MLNYNYLIVGGGMTAAAAVAGIREIDRTGTIGLIGAEPHLEVDELLRTEVERLLTIGGSSGADDPPGVYNIVDGNPLPQHVWLTAFARAVGAPAPPRVSEEEALRTLGPDAVYYATKLRGVSNEKARRELEFRPRPLEWI
jgi:nucleoside-diphosphate-sugar epimerase